jgi:hypothetical protein
MVPNNNAKHFRIKAAQRDLIAAAGGIERAAEICSYGKSTVGRWSKIDLPEIMPPDAVEALETETGLRLWTVAWLGARGLKLADDAAGETGNCLATEMATLGGAFGSLFSEWSTIAADGHATPAEADGLLRRHLPEIDAAVDRLKDAAAKVIADGGSALFRPRVVGGGQG